MVAQVGSNVTQSISAYKPSFYEEEPEICGTRTYGIYE